LEIHQSLFGDTITKVKLFIMCQSNVAIKGAVSSVQTEKLICVLKRVSNNNIPAAYPDTLRPNSARSRFDMNIETD
jgi:hypothetical protein